MAWYHLEWCTANFADSTILLLCKFPRETSRAPGNAAGPAAPSVHYGSNNDIGNLELVGEILSRMKTIIRQRWVEAPDIRIHLILSPDNIFKWGLHDVHIVLDHAKT